MEDEASLSFHSSGNFGSVGKICSCSVGRAGLWDLMWFEAPVSFVLSFHPKPRVLFAGFGFLWKAPSARWALAWAGCVWGIFNIPGNNSVSQWPDQWVPSLHVELIKVSFSCTLALAVLSRFVFVLPRCVPCAGPSPSFIPLRGQDPALRLNISVALPPLVFSWHPVLWHFNFSSRKGRQTLLLLLWGNAGESDWSVLWSLTDLKANLKCPGFKIDKPRVMIGEIVDSGGIPLFVK